MPARGLLSLSLILGIGAAQAPLDGATPAAATGDAVAAALIRAGDNRTQLEQALAKVPEAQRSALEFLIAHMPDSDLRALPADFLLQQVALACDARERAPWRLSDELFLGFVLPYAQANERREDWRSDFVRRCRPLVEGCTTPGEAALRLNQKLFAELGVHYSTGRARADQCPSESIAQGKASCTGLSILLADACRAVAVPARLVSVRWPHKPGNHTWVECWDGAAWRFVGADEPDPNGFDHAWFVGDAARCATAEPTHRPWALSFAATGQRFRAGWGPGVELWGIDRAAAYAGQLPDAAADDALRAQFARWFAATAEERAKLEFDRNLDAELKTEAGDARLRQLAWQALLATKDEALQLAFHKDLVEAGDKVSPYTVKTVGERPERGYGLVIAMHGGGGVRKEVNDQQWRVMQRYYHDHPEHGGYRYVALRAPTDEWNGFYTDYVYPLIERLIRQFVVHGDVDPDRVFAIGYSHGGYGAFAIGPKLPDRFAAVHASAAAPTDGETSAVGLHHLPFSFMVGGKDTAYGRRERCEGFATAVQQARGDRSDLYPVAFTLIEGNGHTGLPDRDKLGELLVHRRQLLPRELHWEPTDTVVRHHYWLALEAPQKGQRVDATLADQQLTLALHGVPAVLVHLDARRCDLGRPLQVVVDGQSRTVAPAPSVRTLCESLAERFDPALAWTWELRVP